jgi:hypothetical protein
VVLLQEFRAPQYHVPLLLSRKLTEQQREDFKRRAAAKGGAEVAAVTFLLNEQEDPLQKIGDSGWVEQYLGHLKTFMGILNPKEPEEWELVGAPGAPGALSACTTSPQCTSQSREGLQTACRTAWGGSTLVVFRGEELFEAAGYYPPAGTDVVVKEVSTLPAFQTIMQNAAAHLKACENREPATTWLTVSVIQAACQNPSYGFSLPSALAVIVRQDGDVEEAYRRLLSPVGGHLRDYWEAVDLLYQMVQHFTAEHRVLFELAGTFHADRKMLASAAAGRMEMALDQPRVRCDPERPVESGQDFMRTHACRLFGCPHDSPREVPLPAEMRDWDRTIRPGPLKKKHQRGSRGTKRSSQGQSSFPSPGTQPKQPKKMNQAPAGIRPGPSTSQSSAGTQPATAEPTGGQGSQPGPSTSSGRPGSLRQ